MPAGGCYHCSIELNLPDGPVGRREACPKCGRDVRVCYNCVNYDRGSYNECREPQADRVVDKEKGNFCDYFSLSGSAGNRGGSDKADALKKLDDLFKKT